MSYTLDETGKALTITEEGVTQPADYTFNNVNEFVHAFDTHYEYLECLCLGMATHIEALNNLLAEAHIRFSHYEPTRHNDFMRKVKMVLNGDY